VYTVVMIVRDEEARLPRALASVRRAPEIVVAYTGSRDRTPELASRAGAQVVERMWRDDFAWAREAAAREATSPWLLTLDADEQLHARDGDVHGSVLRALARADRRGANLVLVRRDYLRGVRFWHPLAWRNGTFRWRHAVHEHLVAVDGERRPIAADDLWVAHPPDKVRRSYVTLTAAASRARPADPWLAFQHARELALAARLAAARPALRHALTLPGLGILERSELLCLLAHAAASTGDADAAAAWASATLEMFPRREAALAAARACLGAGNRRDARRWVRIAAGIALPRVANRAGRSGVPYLIDRTNYSGELVAGLWREAA
jgi:hypothetical protein